MLLIPFDSVVLSCVLNIFHFAILCHDWRNLYIAKSHFLFLCIICSLVWGQRIDFAKEVTYLKSAATFDIFLQSPVRVLYFISRFQVLEGNLKISQNVF